MVLFVPCFMLCLYSTATTTACDIHLSVCRSICRSVILSLLHFFLFGSYSEPFAPLTDLHWLGLEDEYSYHSTG